MNTQVETDTKKERVAKHVLLDSSGTEVEDFEKATGIRYIDISSGETFDDQSGLSAGTKAAMIYCFGARTLATNEASAVRNSKAPGNDDSPQAQMAAIRDRFSLIENGAWVDRTREAGVRWDPQRLATAAVNVTAREKGLSPQAQADIYEKLFKRLTEDEKFAGTLRQVVGVESEYRALSGKQQKSVDDLLAAI